MADGVNERNSKRRKLSSTSGSASPDHYYSSQSHETASEDDDSSPASQTEGDQSDSICDNSTHEHPESAQVKQNRRYRKTSGSEINPSKPMDSFHLQINELLRNAKLRYTSLESLVNGIFQQVKEAIENTPTSGPFSIQEVEKHMSNFQITIPFSETRPSKSVNYKFAFSRPETIFRLGNVKERIASQAEGRVCMNVAVKMPSDLFTEKDFLNHRYFHKRAYYLAKLAASIRDGLGDRVDMTFEEEDGNPNLPLLKIQPKIAGVDPSIPQSNVYLRIVLFVSQQIFPAEKSLPNKNCVRASQSTESELSRPTPFYNGSLWNNVAIETDQQLRKQASQRFPGFPDACLLGGIWLQQRGFGNSLVEGGFGQGQWSTLLALLLNGHASESSPAFMPSFESHQLFQATLQWLARTDFLKRPLTLGDSIYRPEPSKFVPILFSTALNLNILYKMTVCSYETLRREASISIRALSRGQNEFFDSCFILKQSSPFLRFDYVATAVISSEIGRNKLIQDEPSMMRIAQQVHGLLHQGFSDRVTSVNVNLSKRLPWKLSSVRPQQLGETLLIGFTINPDVALRRVDRGPPVEDEKAAAAFRKFWGRKSEQRRFRDGSVLESVSWSTSDARSLVQEIMSYILKTHIGEAEAQSVVLQGNDLKWLFAHQSLNIASFDPIVNAFNALDRDIRALKNMPLQIRQIRPASSALCFTSRHVPTGFPNSMKDPTDITIQFEGSGRWPEDLNAIQMTKLAFLLKMKHELSSAQSTLITRIGIENEHFDLRNRNFLQVNHPESPNFHVRIHHEREHSLMEGRLKDKSTGPKDRETIAGALASYKRSFDKKPAHVGAMKTLAQRHLALSPATQLLKAWFGSHLLGTHVTEELIELISARIFVHPFPWTVPNTPMTAFLRSLLFLSRWDWQHEPLVVDFSTEANKDTHEIVQTRFQAWRKIDPAMNRVVIFAATNFDIEGTTWTEYSPSKVIASRMTNLAKAATATILRDGANLQLDRLFKLSLKDYDFILHLGSSNSRKTRKKNGFKNLQQQLEHNSGQNTAPQARFFYEELKSIYGNAAVLFHDTEGDNLIAGIWNPAAGKRPWKRSLDYSTQPSTRSKSGDFDVCINKNAILADMARLGGDLVNSITTK